MSGSLFAGDVAPSVHPNAQPSTQLAKDGRIVYLVDASGSMLSVFPRVKEELLKSIDHLKPGQKFNIIFIHEDRESMVVLTKTDLLPATPDNKGIARSFVKDQGAIGGDDPIPAISLAFKQKPDLIYVVTDGFDNVHSYPTIVQMCKEVNVGKATKVNAILLKSRDDPAMEKMLQMISDDSGGSLKIVNEKDF